MDAPSTPAIPPDGQSSDPAHRRGACGRRADAPWRIPLAGWVDILWRTKEELTTDNVTVVSAGVAFFGLLAFVPTIGSLVAVYGLLADPHDVAQHLAAFSEVIPAAGGRLVRTVLEAVVADSRQTLSVSAVAGIAVALYGSSRGMRSLMSALTIAYDEDPRRSWVRERALSFAYTAGAIAVLAVTIALVVVVPTALRLLGLTASTSAVVAWLRWPLLMLISCASLAWLYRHGAARRPPDWRWTIIGAALATVLWLAGSGVLSFYVHRLAQLDESYGPLGAFLVLMLWFFMASYAVLLGAEINAEAEHQTEHDTTVGEDRPLGERDAFVADHLGACRPPIEEIFHDKLRMLRSIAESIRDRYEREDSDENGDGEPR